MRRIPVVTTFLLRRDGDRERLLLLRRSQQVGSYPGRWAGVSGYMETDPDRQALTEVQEETGLEEADVELLSRGETVEAADRAADRVWVVHPYLYLARRPDNVRLDWEHTESRWVSPESIGRYRTVPGLGRALRQVYPPLPAAIEAGLREIRQDRTHGASELARQGAVVLALAAEASRALTRAAFVNEMRRAAVALAMARPSMAPLTNVAAQLLDEINELGHAGLADLKRETARLAQERRQRSEEASQRIAQHSQGLIRGTVVTNSYSSTVIGALLHNRALVDKVVVAEGRPGLEGRATAREVALAGIPVLLVTDAVAPFYLSKADTAVVGADTVTATGAVVNKAGTYALALAARDRKAPFYVLAETLKLSPRKGPPPLEAGPPAEVWPEELPGVEAANLIFDVTPGRLVRAYVTEEGCLDRRGIAARARALRRSWRRLQT